MRDQIEDGKAPPRRRRHRFGAMVRRYPGMQGLSCTSDRLRNHRCSPQAAAIDLLAETSRGAVIRYIAHSPANIPVCDVNRGLAGVVPTDISLILLASRGGKILIPEDWPYQNTSSPAGGNTGGFRHSQSPRRPLHPSH